ncbi:ubiquitin thiolesterase [Mitosporidium daphniae]|uniref:Ubiquitin thiolesterase n=1 Tax=Mitosporidium daphniae TaxID=1485682 RepID=A0A098VYL6_9MICR|nr:ubiquitin thiolesterase [Mitosporidium daphniae]KGG52836.1 ubiquitin thiolesterase [Mitosporidium daphniae]|eukprot:XP_013239308.1 ubiquitin thiolesterase [Mitosporidium daphniae]
MEEPSVNMSWEGGPSSALASGALDSSALASGALDSGDLDSGTLASTSCPYLASVDRARLDFDFERICSVTLSNFNIYGCLVCGKYFQGRNRSSPAYFHSLNDDHHVFINLQDRRVYSLPENYEVLDSSLDDIKSLICPMFSAKDVQMLDTVSRQKLDLHFEKMIIPGFIGLNNIKANDYVNVVVQAISHIPTIRDYFLLGSNRFNPKFTHLVSTFGNLTAKIWNFHPFKNHVSPHELLQTISLESAKKYSLSKKEDPSKFLVWFLNILRVQIYTATKGTIWRITFHKTEDLIANAFQGKIRIISRKPSDPVMIKKFGIPLKIVENLITFSVTENTFFTLQLDIPPSPLFLDEKKSGIIPQVSIIDLLSKFNGTTAQDLGNIVKEYKIISLPAFLILHVNRFKKNQFKLEKSRTIVNFPLEGLSVSSENGVKNYRIIANIVFEGQEDPTIGQYRIYLLNKVGKVVCVYLGLVNKQVV